MNEANGSEPIKIPLKRRWREARFRYLPVLVFSLVVIAVFYLWDHHVAPTSFTGMAEADRSLVMSPRSGILLNVSATRFDTVYEGDEIARVFPADPAMLRAQLDVILAEVELIRSSLDPIVDQQRNLINYEGLRLDLMNARIDLATTRINRDRMQRELARSENLFGLNLISESEYDLIRTEFESMDLEVQEKQELISDMETRLLRLGPALTADPSVHRGMKDPVTAAIDVKERELKVVEAEMSPFVIRAPITGMISQIFKVNGDYASEGEPLFTISASGTQYVVGYLRQPVSRLPEAGATVDVRSRSRRSAWEGQITHIGTQMEPVHEAMLRPGQAIEYALPVRIEIPPDSDLLPGELVDISVR